MTDAMNKVELFSRLTAEIKKILAGGGSRDQQLLGICEALRTRVPYYDWVGFYLAVGQKKELHLGPYVGASTEHVSIPFGRGICGQAAQTEKTFVVQDVSKETNYLSCSKDVRSEIVVPIFKDGKVAGEIDIDSHSLAPFSVEDTQFLESVAQLAARII